MIQDQVSVCTCGRAYSHCKICGKRSIYYQKMRSMNLSLIAKKEVRAYRCACGVEFSDDTPCSAEKMTTNIGDMLVPGSIEYARAMNEWVSEYSLKKGVNVNKAFCEAKRQGWQPELYEMEDDLREALETAGLISATAKPVAEQTGPQESAVTLDDIIDTIKNLQEDSK